MTQRFELKAATDELHRALDDRLSLLDFGRADDYRRFLDFQARTLPSMEKALASAGLDDWVAGWSDFRRTEAIEADLEILGDPMPPPAHPPAIANTAELLGTAYVLEGSRLGGRVLRQRVGEGLPTNFLSGDTTLGPWPSLLGVIEQYLCSDTPLNEAKGAARRSFSWYLQVAEETGI